LTFNNWIDVNILNRLVLTFPIVKGTVKQQVTETVNDPIFKSSLRFLVKKVPYSISVSAQSASHRLLIGF